MFVVHNTSLWTYIWVGCMVYHNQKWWENGPQVGPWWRAMAHDNCATFPIIMTHLWPQLFFCWLVGQRWSRVVVTDQQNFFARCELAISCCHLLRHFQLFANHVTHLFRSLHNRFSRHMALYHMGHLGHRLWIHAQIQHGGTACCTTMPWLRAKLMLWCPFQGHQLSLFQYGLSDIGEHHNAMSCVSLGMTKHFVCCSSSHSELLCTFCELCLPSVVRPLCAWVCHSACDRTAGQLQYNNKGSFIISY